MVVSDARGDAKGLVAGAALDVGLLLPPLGRAENTLPVLVVTVAGPVKFYGEVAANEVGMVGQWSIAPRLVLREGFVKEKFFDELWAKSRKDGWRPLTR